MTYKYSYHEHKYNKVLFEGLDDYIDNQFPKQEDGRQHIPIDLMNYYDYLKERFDTDPVSILDYYEADEDEYPLHDPDDRMYPSDQFLISLRETVVQMTAGKFRMIMRAVCDAWWDFCDEDFVVADDKNLTYTLYTCGWSGNEDILDALLGNISIAVAADVENKGAVWALKYRLADKEVIT